MNLHAANSDGIKWQRWTDTGAGAELNRGGQDRVIVDQNEGINLITRVVSADPYAALHCIALHSATLGGIVLPRPAPF